MTAALPKSCTPRTILNCSDEAVAEGGDEAANEIDEATAAIARLVKS